MLFNKKSISKSSPKRTYILSNFQQEYGKKGKLINLCVTRWVEIFHSVSRFVENIQSIVQALKFIHNKKYDPSTTSKSLELIDMIEYSKNIYAILISNRILAQVQSMALYLQAKNTDLSIAVREIYKLIKKLETMKIDKTFDSIYEQVQNICTSIGIFITMNRNIEDRDKKKYYKHTYFMPAIDRIIMDLTTRISENEERFQ